MGRVLHNDQWALASLLLRGSAAVLSMSLSLAGYSVGLFDTIRGPQRLSFTGEIDTDPARSMAQSVRTARLTGLMRWQL